MGIPLWIVSLIGKQAEKKIGWTEGPMQGETKWFKSKGVWTGIVTVLVGAYETSRVVLAPQIGWNLPDIPPVVYTLLGALGLYARVVAAGTITK